MVESLYVHIPFCTQICGYCDFTKVLYHEEWVFSYVEVLLKQIDELKIEKPLKTVYVGGGTPSCLPPMLLKKLLNSLFLLLDHKDYEFTIEANPDGLDEEKLQIMKEAGVNRLSLGVESSNDDFLRLMGRKYTFKECIDKVNLAKTYGFTNISCDLIYGLPGETLDDVKKDVKALLDLDVPHLSTYSLTVDKGTSWYKRGFREMDDSLLAEQYELILKELRKKGYSRYEVSNFALEGYESRHNLTYWKDNEYYALGLGAAGYLNKKRFTLTKNLNSYLKGRFEGESEELSEKEIEEEFLLTNLRLEKGFSEEEFKKRFGYYFRDKYKKELKKLSNDGLLKEENGKIFTSDKGLLLLDRILLELFK